MRLFAAADIHGNLNAIDSIARYVKNRSIDGILVAGDIGKSPYQIMNSEAYSKWCSLFIGHDHFTSSVVDAHEQSIKNSLVRLSELGVPVFVVPGNEDIPKCHKVFNDIPLVINVDRRVANFKGLKVVGFGGCNHTTTAHTFYEWSEETARRVLNELFTQCLDERILLLSHAPPFGTLLDFVGMRHIGSFAIRSTIKKFSPLICICGHVHEASGVEDVLSRTIVINPGCLESAGLIEDVTQSVNCSATEIVIDENEKGEVGVHFLPLGVNKDGLKKLVYDLGSEEK